MHRYIDPLSALGPSGGPDLGAYLGSAAVRNALHAQPSPNAVYHLELDNNGYPQYTLNYAACNNDAVDGLPSMLAVYRELLALSNTSPGLRQVIISNGDIDPVVDMHGTEKAVQQLGLPVALGAARRPWFFNATGTSLDALASTPTAWGASLHAHPAGAQVGGFVTSYETGPVSRLQPGSVPSVQLHYVVVRNSGHMVPAFAPQRALHMLEHTLIGGAQLAPPLPSGWDVAPDEQFYARGGGGPGIFAKWIQRAITAL